MGTLHLQVAVGECPSDRSFHVMKHESNNVDAPSPPPRQHPACRLHGLRYTCVPRIPNPPHVRVLLICGRSDNVALLN
jgi:hypothetical protein